MIILPKEQVKNGLCEALRSLLLLEQIWLTFKSCKRCPLIIYITTKQKNTAPTSSPSDFRTAEQPCAAQAQSCGYVNAEEKEEKSKLIPPSEKKKQNTKTKSIAQK